MQQKQNNILFPEFEQYEKELLLTEIAQLEKELAMEEALMEDAFEWILEFPELLDNELNWKGFNLIIGNPPYTNHKKLKKFNNYLSKNYQTYSSTGDVSIYFFELAFNLLPTNGFLNYINTNKFFRTEYGKNCRDLLAKNQIQYIVNFEQVPIFKEALVSSTIICNQKTTNDYDFPFAEFAKEPAPEKNFRTEIKKRNKYFNGFNLNSRAWSFSEDNVQKIKTIIESKGKPIKDIETIEIFRGVTTGFDDAFIINQDTYNELISKDKKNNEIIKPLLKGKDIKKYLYKYDNLYLINSHSGLRKKIDRIDILTDYPIIYTHFKNINSNSNGAVEKRADQGEHWTNLRHCAFLELFEQEKIIWALTADKWGFALDKEKHYLTSGGYLLVSKQISLKYILAILNSTLMWFYFSQIGVMTAGGAYTLKKATIERFPLIELSETEQLPFIELVDLILKNKQKNTDTTKLEYELDQLVYKVYNIKPDEIQIIENAA
jgi:hypothetical protein